MPAYNDAKSIVMLVLEALALLPDLTEDYEVIVVNDGSTDVTGAMLDEFANTQPRVKVIHHARNKGYGGALHTGFETASKELVFYTDGDGQYDVRELLALWPLLTPEVDVVNGYKVKRADAESRKLLGAVYNRLARLLFRIPIRDVDCDFRLIRRSALMQIELTSSSGVICVELVHKLHRAGCAFVETPVHHYPRLHGRSQFFTPRRVARTAFDLLSLWLRLIVLPKLVYVCSFRRRGVARATVGEASRPELNIFNNKP
jgi:glycosyltransferase involved in cell wall biosynthesis